MRPALRLTTIFLSRLLLNLRDDRDIGHADSTSSSTAARAEMSTLAFTGALGPLGNSVDDGLSPNSDGDCPESDYEGDEIGAAEREVVYDLEAECGWDDLPEAIPVAMTQHQL